MMKTTFSSFFEKSIPTLKNGTIYLGILITLAGLAIMAYLGWYNRYWSDDWCYNVDFENLGITGALNTYFVTGNETLRGYGYSNNRYSLTLLSGILFQLGRFGAQITAALVIVCWLTGLLWLLFNLSKMNKTPFDKAVLSLGVALLVYYSLYISPQRFQVLHWTAGIHYSFSIISGVFLAALLSHRVIQENRSRIIDYLIAPLAFLAGGFSETGCAYLLGAAMLALATAWIWRQKQSAWAIRIFPALLVTFLALVAALVVLAVSPSNAARVEIFSREPTSLPLTLILSFRFALEFVIDSVRSLPLPHLVFGLAFLSLSILACSSSQAVSPNRSWKPFLSILVVILFVWLLISAVQAPTVYFYGTPPDPRGKSLARFTMLAGLAIIAWLTGQWISTKWKTSLLLALALTGITLSMAYTARSLTIVRAELPGFIHRANLWDQRDSDIRQARLDGITQLEVIVIDTKDMGVKDIMASSQMNGEWVSTCASRYYGLEAIKAISP